MLAAMMFAGAYLLMASAGGGQPDGRADSWPAAKLGCGDWTERGASTRQEAALRLTKSLEGYRLVRRRFEIIASDIDCGIPEPPSLRVRLRVKDAGIPDSIEWFDPLGDDLQPIYTWKTLLAVYKSGSSVVSRHPWIADWASRSMNREVCIRARGISGVQESVWELETFVRPVWQLAAFNGQPELELLLRRSGNDPAAQVWLSASDNRSLVTITFPDEHSTSMHWLDVMKVHAHPTDSPCWDYLTVSSQGEWSRPSYDQEACPREEGAR